MYNPFFHPLRQALLNYAPPAGDGLSFKSINQYFFTIPGGETFCDVTITQVVTSKSFIDLTFRQNGPAVATSDILFCSAEFLNSTTVRLTRGNAHATQWPTGYFFVYEFDTGIIDVTFGQQNMSGLSIANVTVPPYLVSKAMLFSNYHRIGGASSVSEQVCTVQLSNDDIVRIRRSENSDTDYPIVNFFLVRFL